MSKNAFIPSPRQYSMLKNAPSCDTLLYPLQKMNTVVTGQKPIAEKIPKLKNTK
jgi:hypothetical protein